MKYFKGLPVAAFVLSMFIFSGCFSSRPEDIKAFTKPYEVDVTADDYILQPPDEVEVHASQVPELHQQRQRIRPDGKVSFEGIGPVIAAGNTPDQLADIIREKAAKLYTLPGDRPIDVRISAYQSKRYYVLGQVQRPGPKMYTGRDTVLFAISDAQPTSMAWDKRTQIVRPSENPQEDPRIFEVNYQNMIVHGDTSKDVLLEEGDVVYVPPTPLAAVGLVLEEFLSPVGRAFSTVWQVQRIDN